MATDSAVSPDSMLSRYQRAAEIQAADAHHWILNENVLPHWISGRDAFWYKRETPAGHRFTLVDAATGAKSDAFDHARLGQALGKKVGKILDPDNLPLNAVRISLDEGTVRFSAFGKFWRFDRTNTLSEEAAPRGNYAISPDGKLGVFSKGNNLWVEDLKTGAQTQLTFDGEQYYAYGAAPAANPAGPPAPKVVWSPDSKRMFTAQTDDRKVLDLPVIDFAPKDGVRPKLVPYRAALPGDQNVPTFRLTIIDVSDGRQTPVRYQPIPAVRMNDTPMDGNRVWWRADSKTAYFVDIERGEKAVHVEAVSADTGAARELFTETSDTYVELGSDVYGPAAIRALPKSNQLIWYSERSGWAHLYLYDLATGKLIRPLTSGDWLVRNILGVDEDRRQVFVSLAGRTKGKNPYYQEIARVDLDTGALKILSASDDDHEVLVAGGISNLAAVLEISAGGERAGLQGLAPSGDYFVETITRADGPSRTLLRDRDGKLIATVESADASRIPSFWRWPKPVQLTAADGVREISGLVFHPSDYDPHKRYPVIDYVYGGPQVAYVPKGFGGIPYLEAASLAELGFVVVMIDGRGTAERSREFHVQSYGKVETASNLEDHIAGIRELAAKDPSIDLSRVGVTGFSAGGYMTAIAMLRFPEFYKVGVAGDGNYDQRLFWATWGERYEGYPVGDYYKQQAALTYAKNLKGKLLLIHGLLDYGVNPGNVFQLEQALIDANKDFDILTFPHSHHDMPGYGTRRLWDYFVENLGGETPPHEFLLKSSTDYFIEKIAEAKHF
jgi:dipeptidyl aminopeptidase/acylaminoacyl peptidase